MGDVTTKFIANVRWCLYTLIKFRKVNASENMNQIYKLLETILQRLYPQHRDDENVSLLHYYHQVLVEDVIPLLTDGVIYLMLGDVVFDESPPTIQVRTTQRNININNYNYLCFFVINT